MEIVAKVRKTISPRSKLEVKQKLNGYSLSQIFTQLVNLQQLIKAIHAFIGTGKVISSDILLDCAKLAVDRIIQSMMHDRYDFDSQAHQIREGLGRLNVVCQEIKVKSLYPKLVKLELVINSPPSDETLEKIQRVLEDTLNEPVLLESEKFKAKQMKVRVRSSNEFKVEHGVSYVGKNGNKVSGDSYFHESFATGKTLLAISDGMGNGEVARMESSEALKILKCLLNFNISMERAIQILQNLKQYSNTDERFFSLDICLIDREKQQATFYKKGATPTFLIRHQQVELINLPQLPVGVWGEESIEHLTIKLKENDVIVMCSDGVIEQYHDIEELGRYILEQIGRQPKMIAKKVLQLTINKNKGRIRDDMLILVAQYKTLQEQLVPAESS